MAEAPAAAPGDERGAIARRAGVVVSGTLLSRVLGAVRDAVIAAVFPVGATDAFWVAFTIPNALRVVLGEGAVQAAFVPVFAEVRAKEGEERARRFYAALRGVMTLVLILVTLIGVAGAPWIVIGYAAGYLDDPAKLDTARELTRWVFPYIFFMGLAALGMGALNALHRYAVPAFAPALLNVAMIVAAVAFVPVAAAVGLPPIGALALGALLGGVLQVVAQWPALRSAGLFGRMRLDFRDAYVREALRRMLPLLAGLGVYELNLILSRQLASFLGDGAQSYLYYGSRVVEIPQGMFALAIATATLTAVSIAWSRGEHEHAKDLFAHSLRLNLFVAVPATVVLVVLAEPTIAVLFGRGRFGQEQILETGRSLAWQAAGIWAIASVRSVVQMFYAAGDSRSPLWGSAANLLVFAGVSWGLTPALGHVGIAIGISAAGAVQLMVLLVLLRRRVGRIRLRETLRSVARTGVASGAAGAVAWGIAQYGVWSRGSDLGNAAIYLGAGAAAVAVYFVVARVLRAPELGDLRGRSRTGSDR